MPTRKIDEDKHGWAPMGRPCLHPEHNPPSMQVFPPGLYEHTCPSCSNVKRFRVIGTTLSLNDTSKRCHCGAMVRSGSHWCSKPCREADPRST